MSNQQRTSFGFTGRCMRSRISGGLLTTAIICSGLVTSGCNRAHGPQALAPTIHGPVNDLAAVRAGKELSLSWTVPKKHIGKLIMNGTVKVRVCRKESADATCTQAGDLLLLAPGATGTFSEMLPQALVAGAPRPLYYSVELLDRKGRSTGTSNSVPTLAGSSLPPLRGLTAQKTSEGVLLRWESTPDLQEPAGTIIRIHRVRLVMKPAPGIDFSSQAEQHDLEVQDRANLDRTLDTTIRNGDSYEYRAQRVVQMKVDGQELELAGELSVPADINLQDSAQR